MLQDDVGEADFRAMPRLTPDPLSSGVTDHASSERRLRTRFIRAVVGGAERRGFDIDDLLDRAGIPRTSLGDEGERVSLQQELLFWQGLEQMERTMALEAARGLWRGALGSVEYAARTSWGVREALLVAHRFTRAMHGTPLLAAEGYRRLVHHSSHEPDSPSSYLCAEFLLTAVALILHDATYGRWRPSLIHLQTPDPEIARRLETLSGATVKGGQLDHAIYFAPGDLDVRMREWDGELNRVLVRQLKREIQDLPLHPEDAVERARQGIEQMLGREHLTLAALARRLGMAPRTLQVRLRRDGWTFRSLTDDVRVGVAKVLLLGDRPLKRIAGELGYQTPQSFHRAFRRIEGTTPGAFRGRFRNDSGQPD
ncbi:MAG: helix-turn-helix domain-containing protein [Myxococcota bacterium]